MWISCWNLHFRFCKNGLAKRVALPWLSGKVLFLFWHLNSVVPQEPFIIYLVKVTFSTYKYSCSSYCGICPVLWHSLLLCLEVVKDKSLLIDVVETYMKVIWLNNKHGPKPNRLGDIWMCWFCQFWGWIFTHFEALRRTVLLTKPFKQWLYF